jgi:CBS-domain-containing membrane protein
MTVGDACMRSVVTATADETIADAAKRMRDRHVGTVVVVDGEGRHRPTGILTDRDIVIGVVAQSPDKVESLLVGDASLPRLAQAKRSTPPCRRCAREASAGCRWSAGWPAGRAHCVR